VFWKEKHVSPANAIEIVLKFEDLINSRNADAVAGILTENSVLIDSLGNSVQGLSKLRAAWMSYFKMVPDYSISHSETLAGGNTVAMFGRAQGTFAKGAKIRKEEFWTTPAAWRAVVEDGKIAVWQVFADNEPIRAIMRKYH
jgi:ketosteroid isomerase-like protein